LCRAAAIEPERRGLLKPWLVLSRALLHFARMPLQGVPQPRRAAAIRLQLLQLSPWPNTGFAFRCLGNSATVWYWDEDALAARLAARGASAASVSVVPETEMRAARTADGALLIRCLDGVEGQVWRDGELQASMWWPQVPDATAWAAFALDAGIEPSQAPVVHSTPWAARPHDGFAVRRTSATTATDGTKIAVRVAAALLGGFAIWLAVAQIRLELAMSTAADARSRIDARLGPVLDLRRRADRDTAAAAQLLALRAPVTQAELLLALADVAGAGKTLTLREWEFRDDRLRLVLGADSERYDRAAALAALARVPWLRDISLAGNEAPDSLALQARVVVPGSPATGSGRP
jgi:hypothetical protein